MNTKNIIQQGTTAKYLMAFDAEGFDPATMDFRLELSWGYRQTTKVIQKSDMIEATGGYLFELDTTEIIGKVKARCVMIYPDTDVAGSERPDVDDQWLCFVTSNPCPNIVCCPKCDGKHPVSYERIDESDIGEKYVRLVDLYDRPLLTSDNEYLYALREVAEQINELLNN